MTLFPIDRRYEEDDSFHALVDRFSVLIEQCAADGIAAPSELRTALTYACMRREMLSTRSRFAYDAASGELYILNESELRNRSGP